MSSLTQSQKRKLKPLVDKARREGWSHWIQTDADRLAVLDGHYFDPTAAERIQAFCRRFLRLENPTPWDGRGRLIPLEPLEWQQREILGPLLGWKRHDGTRRFRFGFITVAKGNGKSILASIILLYLVFAEGEAVPPLGYACSTSSEAARTVFSFCCRLVRHSPALAKRLKVLEHGGRIVDHQTGAILTISPNKAQAVEGKDVHCAVYDEIHLAQDRTLFDALIYGGRSRAQPLVLVITTASKDRQSLAFELYEDAERLLSGAVRDEARFAYVAVADHQDDALERKTWEKANPSLGVTVNADDFAVEAKRAADSPAKMVNFRSRRLNVWGLSDTTTFIDLDRWLECKTDIDLDGLKGRDCYGGLDLSSNTDLTAFTLAFPDEDGSIDVLAWHWLPEDVLAERARTDSDRYPMWVSEDYLEMTEGDYIDQPYIRQRINEIAGRFKVREIAFDPTFASDLGPKLAGDGFEVFEFYQSYRMYTPVMAKLDELVLARKIRHRNPMLDWQVSNMLAHESESGHMKPIKTAKTAKIDGLCALLMALGKPVKGEQEESYDFAPVISFT